MNVFLNYLLEANFGICLFVLLYFIFLKKETAFHVKRIYLLVALACSVVFPILKFQTTASPIPSIQYSIPTIAQATSTLPEVIETAQPITFTVWEILGMVYLSGLILFLSLFILRLFKIINVVYNAPRYRYNNHTIIELKNYSASFSFFNFIFIGTAIELTETEKAQIIEHEGIHAKQFHSVDILITHILGIVFWFNPVIRIYKKTFVQLHEFEADARAVEKHDVNAYCSLLAKAALQSADLKLANYFNNSLTLKRIEMMRTLKQNIKGWKLGALALIIPAFFFVVACQDQVTEQPVSNIIETTFDYPAAVKAATEELNEKNPNDIFIVLPPVQTAPKLHEVQKGKLVVSPNEKDSYTADVMHFIKAGDKDANGNELMWIIFQYKNGRVTATNSQQKTVTDGEEIREIDARPVFYAVEKAADAPGGRDAFVRRIKQKMQYPAVAKQAGVEGKVFIKCIVWSDGRLSNLQIVKGVSKEIDQEALRLLQTEATGWTPAMQNGNTVNSEFMLPIEFKL